MKQALFVDCCIRGETSRTARLARAFFHALKGYHVSHVDVEALDIAPLGREMLQKRDTMTEIGDYEAPMFDLAKQFAAADMVVVAAPFWDMGIPAKLKTYFEHVSVSGIAFNGETCEGVCRAERMVYFTTRGLEIPDGSEQEQATPYLKALCRFFGVGEFYAVSCFGLDMISEQECERRLSLAETEAEALAVSLED